MPCWPNSHWPRNLNQTASGKPGAVQIATRYDNLAATYLSGVLITATVCYWAVK